MQSHQLKRIHPNTKRMIVARGGKRGKTAGRGGKGQSARAGNKRRPEWRDIIKRVPKLRGRGKNSNKSFAERMTVVDLSSIEGLFTANEALTPTILVEKGIVATFKGRIPVVKILANGEITKAVMITGCAISASAKEKVIKVGGSVKDLPSNVVLKVKKPQSEKAKVVAAAALKANAEAKTPKKSDAKTESKGEVKSKEKSKK